MSIFKAIILGILQGITEFLPISSSGHLVLMQRLFNINEGTLFFTIMLHFGSLISIMIVYSNDIVNMIIEFFKLMNDLFKEKKLKLNNEYRILCFMIIVGTIQTALMGIFLKDYFEFLYDSLLAVGIAFLLTGLILIIAEKYASGTKGVFNLKIIDAITIGIFQGFAISPGISRSGSTIVGGLFMGLDKKLATRFSFLLSLPSILGATLLEFTDMASSNSQVFFSYPIVIGTIVSAITGVFAIKLLVTILERGKLYYFSFYLWILGLVIIIVNLV